MEAATIDIRRSGTRYQSRAAGIDTRHSFSFGTHYDPDNTGFGPLLVHDDHRLRPGAGFAEHRHADVEIVTWVLEGALVHEDSTGHRGTVVPGLAARLSAGSGVLHTERNDVLRPDPDGPPARLRFVQAWLRPDVPGTPPTYAARPVDPANLASGWFPVASGNDPDAAVSLGTRSATFWVTRLAPGEARSLPTGPRTHVFVAAGGVAIETLGALDAGDAVRLTGEAPLTVTGTLGAEVCVWSVEP